MAKHEDLDVLRLRRAKTEHDQLEKPAKCPVEKRQHHVQSSGSMAAEPTPLDRAWNTASSATPRTLSEFSAPTGASRLYMPTYTDRDGHRRTTVGWEYVHIALDDESVSFTHRRLGRLAARGLM